MRLAMTALRGGNRHGLPASSLPHLCRFLSSRISDYGPYLSPTSSRRQPSAIRRLAPLLSQEGMVSLGGGLPNPTLFPFHSLQFGISDPEGVDGSPVNLALTAEEMRDALQYSATPGLSGLLQHLRELQKREHGPSLDLDVTVTVGSQDGLTKAFEMLLDPTNDEDELFVESPTYSGALAFLRPFGVKLNPVETDGYGMKPDAFASALEDSSVSSSSSSSPKSKRTRRRVLYTIPTAQNPGGSTLTNERREAVYDLARVHDVLILEDDPYYFLHPQRNSVKSFLSLDTDGRVLRFDSLSKLLSAGMRIGFVTGPKPLMERLNFHVQATNLHNSGLSQAMTAKLLGHWEKHGFDDHAIRVAEFYCRRRDVLLDAAERHMTGLATWDVPEAGMFLWMKLKGIDDTKALIEEKAAKANVLFVPGQSFCPMDEPSPFVRASYSTASDEEMDVAMERLASLVKEEATS